MVFSSLLFLFTYLPIVLLIYYLSPLKWRNGVLLIFNLIFYGWGEPVYIVIMFASIAIDYTHGMLVEKCKKKGNDRGARMAVASSVIFNLALLFFFKYWDFLAGSLAALGLDFMPILGVSLPIGISFYTFQTMTYPVDIYRGDAELPKNLVNFGTFVTLFPQLIAGPIIKYKDLADQMAFRTHSPEKFASGVQIFIVGLGKKVLLANNIGQLWDVYLATPGTELTTLGAWLGILAFSLQLYFDFSGYSDMAVGMGHMLGFRFPDNFRYPYISKSITEFWRRWHISLGTWFKEYVYIPLGGNRVSMPRHILNLLIVWVLTGFWHGAAWNFILWGLYYGILLILEKYIFAPLLKKLPKAARHIYTMLLVMFGWVLFSNTDFGSMRTYVGTLFGIGTKGFLDLAFFYYIRNNLIILIMGVLCATPLIRNYIVRCSRKKPEVTSAVLLLLGILSIAFLVYGTYNPFLYFRF